jgi:hypothetical protein
MDQTRMPCQGNRTHGSGAAAHSFGNRTEALYKFRKLAPAN